MLHHHRKTVLVIFIKWHHCDLPRGHIGVTWRMWLNLCFIWPTRVHNPNGKSIGIAIFLHSLRKSLRLYIGAIFPKIAPSHGGSGPHIIHDSFGQSEPTIPMQSLSVQPFLQGLLVWQTDRPTDHATQSVITGHMYVCSTAMWPNNTQFFFEMCNQLIICLQALIFNFQLMLRTTCSMCMILHLPHFLLPFNIHFTIPLLYNPIACIKARSGICSVIVFKYSFLKLLNKCCFSDNSYLSVTHKIIILLLYNTHLQQMILLCDKSTDHEVIQWPLNNRN